MLWKLLNAAKWASKLLKLKQEFTSEEAGRIASWTATYEERIRKLWEAFKRNPSKEGAEQLAKEIKKASIELWPQAMADVLGLEVGNLPTKHRRKLTQALAEHHDYIDTSLLPDVIRAFEEGAIFDSLDHRVVFMYAGALWSFGFLTTVMFDGLDVRDLADLFIFLGPNDSATCQGDRGCAQFANKVFPVYRIIAEDIIPGHLQCYTNCRHMLLPVASPLTSLGE